MPPPGKQDHLLRVSPWVHKKRKKTANSKPSEQMVTVEGSHVSIMEANSEMVTVEGSHASTREARSYTAGESLGTQKCHK